MRSTLFSLTVVLCIISWHNSYAQKTEISASLEKKVIEWRHDLHEHPELSNREFRTAGIVADHLTKLGIKTRTGIAHTGVVGILKGAKPGPVIALRADMDALPVKERTNLPYASKVMAEYNGEQVPVMHACGHDTHTAMLMGAAEVLASKQKELAGTVVFIFQPAEEGAPKGEEGGAKLMVEEGVLESPKVDAVFGIHINSQTPAGVIKYRTKGIMAAADLLEINIKGKQSHGSRPWESIDPVTIAAYIITTLQTTISRQAELTKAGAVVTVGKIEAGVRSNIIPETAKMIGTIRTLDSKMQQQLHGDIKRVVKNVAEAMGGEATVNITENTLVTYNDPKFTNQMLPTLNKVAGEKNVWLMDAMTGAEDFSYYAKEVPGLFVFVGGMDPNANPKDVAGHHTPDLVIDDRGLKLGVETYVNIALDFLSKEL